MSNGNVMPGMAVLNSLQREADLERDLPMRQLAIDHVAALPQHLEPLDVAQCFDGLGNGAGDGVVAAHR